MSYFFVLEKLPEKLPLDQLPRYSKSDAEELAKRHVDRKIRPDLTFGELWRNAVIYGAVPIEEAKLNLWTWRRIACLGDSIHKMTPNIGAGANAAIESAAALANAMYRLASKGESEELAETEVTEVLKKYQMRREPRTDLITNVSGAVTRLQALDTWVHRFTSRFVLPHSSDAVANSMSFYWIDSEILVREV
jgi:2-polyprenyl-6-methoxyphenol hydroxylase-like FAD-dependent oxidoreductase